MSRREPVPKSEAGFFTPSPFMRWVLTPILISFAVAVPLMTEEWTKPLVALVAVVSGVPTLYALFLIAPGRFWWAGRAAAGLVTLMYAAYLIDRLFFYDGPFGIGGSRSETTPWNALLGLLVIGIPCARYALYGRVFPTTSEVVMEPLHLDVEAADVESELAKYLADPTPVNAEAQTIARLHHALPLLLDWGGPILLRPDGQVLFGDWDAPADVGFEVEPRWRHIVRAHGAIQFPSIRGLAPVRGPTDPTCAQCGGTGRPMSDGKPVPHDNVLCECGGVGWLPADPLSAPPPST